MESEVLTLCLRRQVPEVDRLWVRDQAVWQMVGWEFKRDLRNKTQELRLDAGKEGTHIISKESRSWGQKPYIISITVPLTMRY